MEEKIGDFGLATKLEFDGDRKRTICGTPNYIAPEIIDGKQGHSYEVDIWSLGVIIYTLLIGKPPFETSDVKTTYRKIKMNAYSFPDHITISEASKNLITKILNLDPSKRPTLDEILEHQFFHMGNTLPKLLPASTLACPPSSSYVKQFMPSSLSTGDKQRLESTTPIQSTSEIKAGNKPSFQNTDRINLKSPTGTQPSAKTTGVPQPSAPDGKKDAALKGEDKKPVSSAATSIWVKKWVDYTSKYGLGNMIINNALGYMLTNGATGVFFNDSTKIILDPHGQYLYRYTNLIYSCFNYIEKRSSDKQDVIVSHTLTDYPKELQKKITLLQHFRSYLEGDAKGKPSEEPAEPEDKPADANSIYVKKWMRTRHAIMFRLSNKIVQVNFEDHTEIILSSESREVTYVNKKGVRATYPLSTALESTNVEMAKRLKYTKEILTHMLTTNQPHQPACIILLILFLANAGLGDAQRGQGPAAPKMGQVVTTAKEIKGDRPI